MLLERKNGKFLCPECGGDLSSDKKPVVSDQGFIYRHRICSACYAEVWTKQGGEETTHIEKQTAPA